MDRTGDSGTPRRNHARRSFVHQTKGGALLQITPAERMTLELLAHGTPPPAIADSIGVAESEIGSYLTALFSKMGVSSRGEAVAHAFRRGLVTDVRNS
jgi:DNA-binding NarL/FixJ family response regulator